MFKWLSPKSKFFLGIDIGSSTVKIVELFNQDNKLVLSNYGLSKNTFSSQFINSPGGSFSLAEKEISVLIKKIIAKAKIKSRSAIMSVPVFVSFSTLIELPSMPRADIPKALQYEAKKYIPVPLKDVKLDWALVFPSAFQSQQLNRKVDLSSVSSDLKRPLRQFSGSTSQPQTNQDKIQVILIAVPKSIIQQYVSIAKNADLELKAIELEVFSLMRSLIGNDKSCLALIDFGARSTSISLVDQGWVRLIRNYEIGGRQVTDSLAKEFKISPQEAEKLKTRLSDKRILHSHTLRQTAYNIALEAEKIFSLYSKKYGHRPEKCILTGGDAIWFYNSEFLLQQLKTEIQIGKPFSRIAHPIILEPTLKELSPFLAVAAGLAMRGFSDF